MSINNLNLKLCLYYYDFKIEFIKHNFILKITLYFKLCA